MLATARKDGRHLRVVGELCSVNDIAMSDDILVSIKHLNRVSASAIRWASERSLLTSGDVGGRC